VGQSTPTRTARVGLKDLDNARETVLILNVCASRHDLLFTFQAPLVQDCNQHSLQVGLDAHLCSVATKEGAYIDAEGVRSRPAAHWVFMKHAFTPDATVYLRPLDYRNVDPSQGCVAVYAAKNLSAGEALTFDYTLLEWERSTPFVCHLTGREVRGFKHLPQDRQALVIEHAWPHIRQLYDCFHSLPPSITALGSGSQWLTGVSS